MKRIISLVFALGCLLSFAMAQQYTFSNKITYYGYSILDGKNVPMIYKVYWSPNQKIVALEVEDVHGYNTGLMIVDEYKKLQYILDEREHTGVVIPLHIADKFEINAEYNTHIIDTAKAQYTLTKTNVTKQFLNQKATEYILSDKAKHLKYYYWVSYPSRSFEQAMIDLQYGKSAFMVIPHKLKGLILRYLAKNSNGAVLADFKATDLKLDQKFTFDVAQYKLVRK